MPKRKNKDSDSDDYILRKIKKLERKLMKRSRKKSSSVSSDDHDTLLSVQKDNHVEESVDTINIDDGMNYEENTVEPISNEIQETNSTEQPEGLTDQNNGTSEPAIVLDESILELIGETPVKTKNYSSPIQAELAVRWEHIATNGLSKEIKKDLIGKYFLPENCVKISPPKLNPEIKAALSDALVKKDAAIEIKQNQQAVAISCISQALTKICASQNKDTEVIKHLIDATRLLCDYQYTESMSRRSFVTSTIKKEIKDQLYTTQIDNYLFGENLADMLKTAKAISKSGAEMKSLPQVKPTTSQHKINPSRSLKVRPSLPVARQAAVGKKFTPYMQQPRRYQAPPPPPTTSQRTRHYAPPAPPPLPPPPRSGGRTQSRR